MVVGAVKIDARLCLNDVRKAKKVELRLKQPQSVR